MIASHFFSLEIWANSIDFVFGQPIDPQKWKLAYLIATLDINWEITHIKIFHLYQLKHAYWCGFATTSALQLEMAEECLHQAKDLSGLLLLYSSLGDAEGIEKLASLSKGHGKNNVAFLCLFMLGKLEDCIQLLIDRYILLAVTKSLWHASFTELNVIVYSAAIVYLKLH